MSGQLDSLYQRFVDVGSLVKTYQMKTTGQSVSSKVLKNVGTAGLPGDGAPGQVGLVVLDRAASHDPRSPHRRLPDVQV